MPHAKPYVLCFLMGGFYCALGQIFLILWSPIVGPALGLPATLLSMGVVAMALYIPGIHQKLAPKTGWGSNLVFNGFACALAEVYEGAAQSGGAKAGLLAMLDLLLWVIGTGCLLAIVIATACFFMS